MSALGNRIKGWWQKVVDSVKPEPKAIARPQYKSEGVPTEEDPTVTVARRKHRRKALK